MPARLVFELSRIQNGSIRRDGFGRFQFAEILHNGPRTHRDMRNTPSTGLPIQRIWNSFTIPDRFQLRPISSLSDRVRNDLPQGNTRHAGPRQSSRQSGIFVSLQTHTFWEIAGTMRSEPAHSPASLAPTPRVCAADRVRSAASRRGVWLLVGVAGLLLGGQSSQASFVHQVQGVLERFDVADGALGGMGGEQHPAVELPAESEDPVVPEFQFDLTGIAEGGASGETTTGAGGPASAPVGLLTDLSLATVPVAGARLARETSLRFQPPDPLEMLDPPKPRPDSATPGGAAPAASLGLTHE